MEGKTGKKQRHRSDFTFERISLATVFRAHTIAKKGREKGDQLGDMTVISVGINGDRLYHGGSTEKSDQNLELF